MPAGQHAIAELAKAVAYALGQFGPGAAATIVDGVYTGYDVHERPVIVVMGSAACPPASYHPDMSGFYVSSSIPSMCITRVVFDAVTGEALEIFSGTD